MRKKWIVLILLLQKLQTKNKMNKYTKYTKTIRNELEKVSSPEKIESTKRYFPHGITCIGASASDIKIIIANFHSYNSELSAQDVLCITEEVLKNSKYSEEVMVAYGLINKFVKKNYDDDLLKRFEYWLENYSTNWALVDDLCIKTIYNFLLGRPHLIEKTQHWSVSKVSWCRRASNVVWVKFIKRKTGKSIYYLDKNLVFQNCDILLRDDDEFVQKSVGWILKVCSMQHDEDVINYIHKNHKSMERSTIRYAIEKFPKETRQEILQLT